MKRWTRETSSAGAGLATAARPPTDFTRTDVTPLGAVARRQYVVVAGDVRVLRVRPWADDVSTLECVLDDGTGRITLVFLGRSHVAGIRLGCRIQAEGMVNDLRGRHALLNPIYTITYSPVAQH